MSKNNQQDIIIQKTKNWIDTIVIALNFCPFAKFPFKQEKIDYKVDFSNQLETHLETLNYALNELNENQSIETTLITYPLDFEKFEVYLDFVYIANQFLADSGYEGIFQIASFHPSYQFAQTSLHDPANFTNRSPYPMVHLLRESSVEKARFEHSNIDEIPQNNIQKAQELGHDFFQDFMDKNSILNQD